MDHSLSTHLCWRAAGSGRCRFDACAGGWRRRRHESHDRAAISCRPWAAGRWTLLRSRGPARRSRSRRTLWSSPAPAPRSRRGRKRCRRWALSPSPSSLALNDDLNSTDEHRNTRPLRTLAVDGKVPGKVHANGRDVLNRRTVGEIRGTRRGRGEPIRGETSGLLRM